MALQNQIDCRSADVAYGLIRPPLPGLQERPLKRAASIDRECNKKPRLRNLSGGKEHRTFTIPARTSRGTGNHLPDVKLTSQRADVVVKCLHRFGMAVIDQFMGEDYSNLISKEAENLTAAMRWGQTIKEETEPRKRYRSDLITWVHGNENSCQNIGEFLRHLDALMRHVSLKLTDNHIEGRTQAMVACYPGNKTHYTRHVDNPYRDGRLLTCIYYLNENWTHQDGGLLRIYPGGSKNVASVEPILDRLIIFWSDNRSPHEVLPTNKPRFAITVWYFDKDERAAALKKYQISCENDSTSSMNHQPDKTDGRQTTTENNNQSQLKNLNINQSGVSYGSHATEDNVVDFRRRSVSFVAEATPKVDLDNVGKPEIHVKSGESNERFSSRILSPRNRL